MKQTIFTILFFTAIVLVSCRKNQYNPDIKQFDEDQITAYIKANNITGMVRDTSGSYYKIIYPGTGSPIQYSDSISMVFTIASVDGKFTSPDTILNHFEDFTGHMQQDGYPLGLQNAIHNILNHRGGVMRIIIPSHNAYGVSGKGSGSSTLTSSRIAGNQCLDYYVHIIGNQDAYDQQVIKNYITATGTPNMKQDVSGIWYSISTPGTGTVAITDSSTVTATYTQSILNTTVFEEYNVAGGTTIDMPDLIKGMQIGLKKYATTGALMSFIIPSSMAYGKNIHSGVAVAPANSPIRFDIQVLDTAP